MKANVVVLVTFLAMLSFGFTGNSRKKNVVYAGDAMEVGTASKVYTEEHEEVMDADKHIATITNYKDPSGKIIAKRKLDFSKSFIRPDFKLEDLREGYVEGAEVTNGGIRVFKKKKGEELKSKEIVVPEPSVVDGGFNYFVKSHWDEIMKGSVVTFNFVVPSQLDYYKFRVRKVKEGNYQGRTSITVNLEVDNFLMRAFVSPIKIMYDVQTRRILLYEGISNINKPAAGQCYVVRLIYPTFGP